MNRRRVKAFYRLLICTGLVLFAGAPIGEASFEQESNPGSIQKTPDGILASTSFSWVDITGSGKALSLENWVNSSGEHKDDEGQAGVDLPWPFPWFGNNYTTLFIDANGNVGFEDWSEDTWRSDNRIPSANQPNNRIAAFYEDMAGPDTGACGGNEGGVYTAYDSTANRFVVEFYKWCSWDDFDLNTFEVILYPDGRASVQYLEIPSAPADLPYGDPPGTSVIGVEGPDGEAGLIWNGTIQAGAAWLYQPSGSIGTNRLYLPLIR